MTEEVALKNRPILAGLIVLITVALLLTACGDASEGNSPAKTLTPPQSRPTSEIDSLAGEFLNTYVIPGVAVGIIKDGKIVYTKGYGVRNVQTRQPVTADTLFQIASITKSFVGLAIAQQVEAGKLAWDAPIVKYVPDFKFVDDKPAQKLTLRHLVSQTSGLSDSPDLLKFTSPNQTLDLIKATKFTAEPGKKWEYANVNYVLAAYVLEKVTGKSWQSLVQTQIFDPLGMKTASFSSTVMQQKPDYASPHALDILSGSKVILYSGWVEALAPAGIINASTIEMLQYALMQMNGGLASESGKRIIRESYLAETQKQQSQIDGGPAQPELINNKGYALGWINEEYKGQTVVAHNGGIEGFHSYLTMFPASKSAVLVLINADDQDRNTNVFMQILRTRLVDWLFGQSPDPKVTMLIQQNTKFNLADFNQKLQTVRSFKPDAVALQKLAGEYQGDIGKLTITVKDTRLIVQIPDSTTVELVQSGLTEFIANTRGTTGEVFTIKPNQNGQLTIYQDTTELARKTS